MSKLNRKYQEKMESKKDTYKMLSPEELIDFQAQMVKLDSPLSVTKSISSNVNDSLYDQSEKIDEKIF